MVELKDLLDIRQKGDPPRENPFPGLEIVTDEQMQRFLGQPATPNRLKCDEGVWIAERFKGKRKKFWRFHSS